MRFRTPIWGLGVVCAIAAAAPARAATIAVAAGGDFQAALNAAQPGDVITLQAGATFVGNFVLPDKGVATDFITIRSSALDDQLPAAGVRMTPAYAALLPKIHSANSTSALRTAAGTNHWRLMFLEFQANYKGYGDIIELGAGDSTQTDLSQVPYQIVMDRVYVHGDPVMGQKRGIALNSSDTTILNCYVSDIKAVGQDAQALGGFNGPGNYLIENNYLEAAAENFLLGGADPPIQNLVTANVTFRRNYLSKPLAWRNAIVATPAGVTASAASGAGALAAGTYFYKVVARSPAGQTTLAVSAPSTEVSATVAAGTTGGVTVSWTPVSGATDYLVYGRASGGENVYWHTTTPYFTDTGTAGTSGTPSKTGTVWTVKNVFELKNAQDVVVEGNVMENLWIAAQPGYPVVFTPRNQSGTAPWVVVQRVTFRNNLVRHTAGGVNILGYDNLNPSQQTNHLTIQNNVFDDLTAATWGSGSRPFQIGDGPDSITIDHNTVITTQSSIVGLYGGSSTSPTPITNSAYTNNMSAHNKYGIIGANYGVGLSSINAYLPNGVVAADVLAGGSASLYPTGNFFPTVSDWEANFVNYSAGDYHLISTSAYKNAGTDGADLGANVDAITAEIGIALSGNDSAAPGTNAVQIMTATLPDATYQQAYSASLACSGGSGSCAWQLVGGTLPPGLALSASGVISGTPTSVETDSVTVGAYDPTWPDNYTTRTLSLAVDAPPITVTVPTPSPAGQVALPYQIAASETGVMGTPSWSVASGALPPGVGIDPSSGVMSGQPTNWGSFTALVQVQDSWQSGRTGSAPLTIAVAPSQLVVTTASVPAGSLRAAYSATLSAIGGTGATAWSIGSGALPSGLTLDPSGVISGQPAAVGAFTFTAVAADTGWAGNTASQSLTLVVHAPEIVLYATDLDVLAGTWSLLADAGAANGYRVWNPNLGVPKLAAALASPANYFEITFQAEAGVPYHLWMRGKADNNYWGNDSVFVQFSGAVDASGNPIDRIGTTNSETVNLENCSGCGLSAWGWQDNAWGLTVYGTPIYFATSGPQTVRVQIREDGFSIDQIVLSSVTYLNTSPGALKNDTTILSR